MNYGQKQLFEYAATLYPDVSAEELKLMILNEKVFPDESTSEEDTTLPVTKLNNGQEQLFKYTSDLFPNINPNELKLMILNERVF